MLNISKTQPSTINRQTSTNIAIWPFEAEPKLTPKQQQDLQKQKQALATKEYERAIQYMQNIDDKQVEPKLANYLSDADEYGSTLYDFNLKYPGQLSKTYDKIRKFCREKDSRGKPRYTLKQTDIYFGAFFFNMNVGKKPTLADAHRIAKFAADNYQFALKAYKADTSAPSIAAQKKWYDDAVNKLKTFFDKNKDQIKVFEDTRDWFTYGDVFKANHELCQKRGYTTWQEHNYQSIFLIYAKDIQKGLSLDEAAAQATIAAQRTLRDNN
jgi:hypothetical protein